VAGSDFTAAAGVLTFAAGESTKTIVITLNPDSVQEPDESFSLVLSAPSAGLEIQDGTAVGIIVNDDVAPNAPPVANVSVQPNPNLVVFVSSLTLQAVAASGGSAARATMTVRRPDDK